MNFSRPGQPVTVFEAQMIAEAIIAKPDREFQRWVLLAQQIGADNLAKIFDEFGDEHPHVPSRENFFAMLYRPIRNQAIRDMRQRTGAELRDIAAQLGVPVWTVRRVLVSVGDTE
jgi:hypothetical protein